MDNPVRTNLDGATVIVSRKLPDDLKLREYSKITSSVNDLLRAAGSIARWEHPDLPKTSPQLIKAQYGSDYLMVIAILGATTTAVLTLATTVKRVADAAESAAKARKINAEAETIEQKNLRREVRDRAKHLSGRNAFHLTAYQLADDLERAGNADLARRLRASVERSTRTGLFDRLVIGARIRKGDKAFHELVDSLNYLAWWDLDINVEHDTE